MSGSERAKRLVGGLYSAIADNLYEPIVVQGAFRVFGRHLHDSINARGREAIGRANGGPILDLPVGTGYFTLDVAEHHDGIVVGADLAEGMVLESQRAARAANLDNLELVRADAHRLPFADGAFACVMCWNGLQVMPGTEATVQELARVLRPGGTLFASILTLPLGDVVSERTRRKLPPMLQGRDRFARAFAAAGLVVEDVAVDRLATVFTATR